MAIKGFIFDFDGLILDTETPVFQAWQEIYRNFNQELNIHDYAKCLGSSELRFNPLTHLEELVGQPIDRPFWRSFQQQREMEFLANQPLLPGILNFLNLANNIFRMGIASSSDRAWVISHLQRFNLTHFFYPIVSADEVANVKPAPDLFIAALEGINLTPQEVIVFEDSPNGIRAAQSAGIFCVAVPNNISSQLDVSFADYHLSSFDKINPIDLIEIVHSMMKRSFVDDAM
jgi:HAD superfamily hydrolase (TIGR01509 family)